MRKLLIITTLLLAHVPSLFSQLSVSADLYPWIVDQAGVSLDYPISNKVSAAASGFWYYEEAALSTAVSGAFGFRIYPFNGKDLGYRGFPKDIRDLGHFFAPYIRIDLEPGYVSVDKDYDINPAVFLDASLGCGVRFFPARWAYIAFKPKGPVRIPVIDDLFVDVSVRYAYQLSQALMSLSSAQEAVVDEVFDPVRVQLSLGYCISLN